MICKLTLPKFSQYSHNIHNLPIEVQALHKVENLQFPIDPTNATFTGSVIDDNTGLPLTSVIVALEQMADIHIATDIDGTFTLTNIVPNPYTVTYQLPGYNVCCLVHCQGYFVGWELYW